MTRVLRSCLVLVLLLCSVVTVAAQQKKSGTKKKPASTAKKPASEPDTITFEDVKDLGKLKDGAYEGNGWYTKYSYRSYSFVKRGSNLTGYAADTGGVWCFQGTFAGNVITITDAVNRDDEYDDHGRQTGRFGFSPLKDYQKPDFVTARMDGELRSFPVRRVGWLGTAPEIVARDEGWMAGCLKHYSEARPPEIEPDPPPCDDEQLRPAMKAAGQWPTYLTAFPHTVCEVKDDPNCTVENVFRLLIENPAAIGPAKNPETQTVEDCGVLVLDSFTNLVKPKKDERAEDDNLIKVDIDEEHHRITNYTMPGHVFWPGQVIREIVLHDGKVGVKTTGYGHEGIIKKWVVNLVTSNPAWAYCDDVLIEAYKHEYPKDE